MLAIKHHVAIIAILSSPSSVASSLTSQLHTFFNAQLVGVSDEVCVSIRAAPNLLSPCKQPLLPISNSSRPWGNAGVSACCDNDERYLQVNVQAIGNHVVAAMPTVWGEELEASNVKLKHGWLDTLPPRMVLNTNQLVDAVNLRDLSFSQPIQLTQFRQAWWARVRQRINVIVSGYGVGANTEGRVLSNATVAQNVRVHMVSGQVISGVADVDGNILINL